MYSGGLLFACLFPALLISALTGCSGKSGYYPPDAGDIQGDPDVDPDVPCPEDRVCGESCCWGDTECVFGQCLPVCETERCRLTCCPEGEECVNDMQCLPVCENARCGDNLTVCCDPGQQCLDGVVCATQCDLGQSLCGENLDTCCEIGQICLHNNCVTPLNTCNDNFDCPDDSYYCDMSIWRCLPVQQGEICEGEPTYWPIEPVLEWYWPGGGHWVGIAQPEPLPVVVVRIDPDSGAVFVRSFAPAPPEGDIYRLWLVSPGSGARLLGAFSAGLAVRVPDLDRRGLSASELLVTREPAGRLATSADGPTESVLYRGRLAPE